MPTPLTPEEDAIFAKHEPKAPTKSASDKTTLWSLPSEDPTIIALKKFVADNKLVEVADCFKKETEAFTTKNIKEYIEFSKNFTNQDQTLLDYEILENATAFATSPVILFNSTVYENATINFNSLEELKDYLKDKNYILYQLVINSKVSAKESVLLLKSWYTSSHTFSFRGVILGVNKEKTDYKKAFEFLQKNVTNLIEEISALLPSVPPRTETQDKIANTISHIQKYLKWYN